MRTLDRKLKVAILGDILHSRVARSDIWGMRRMGIEVHLAGPGTMLPRFPFNQTFSFNQVETHRSG